MAGASAPVDIPSAGRERPLKTGKNKTARHVVDTVLPVQGRATPTPGRPRLDGRELNEHGRTRTDTQRAHAAQQPQQPARGMF